MVNFNSLLFCRSMRILKKFFSIFKESQRFSKMDNYIWIDMEMTGLEIEKDTVLEIACIITTPQLKVVHEGINLVIHQPEEVLNSMNDWCIKHHGQSGLIELSRKSNITLPQADEQMAKFIMDHSKGTKYLAGNTIYMDRLFLKKYLPKTNSLLHFRIIDVSSIKILCSHWYPDKFPKLSQKKSLHKALDDIKQSLQELKNYREEIFK